MPLPEEKIKELVVKAGVINNEDFDDVLQFANRENISLFTALVEKKVISDSDLGILVAKALKIPFVELSKLDISDQHLSIIPERISRKRKILVFGKDNKTIKVALSDPDNVPLLNMIGKKTNLTVVPHFATPIDIDRTFIHYKTDYQKVFTNLLSEDRTQVITTTAHDPPVKKMVDLLIATAYRENASDIHIEPKEKSFLIRFRIDGILRDMASLSKELHDRIVTRIKVLSRLRIDEHLSAQDGKIKTKVDNDKLDLRVSILPIADGEKVVMRLLTSKANFYSLSDLGMNEQDLLKVTKAFKSSYGLLICTGPTGSGKTTTIYTIIKHINTRDINITTVEDPIEYQIDGANQVQVNEKTNLTFAQGLRSILRQDPDSVFVGEVRDNETAGIAINAALTGHLVFTTLHTNNAATALPRLFDMEVEPFLAASTVNLIIAQRLVRKICSHCKGDEQIDTADLLKFFSQEELNKAFGDSAKKKTISAFKGAGCKFCHESGYSGRIGVYEVLTMSEKIRDLVANKASAEEIETLALKEGMTAMMEDGLKKVVDGLTTIEEVLRVTKTIE